MGRGRLRPGGADPAASPTGTWGPRGQSFCGRILFAEGMLSGSIIITSGHVIIQEQSRRAKSSEVGVFRDAPSLFALPHPVMETYWSGRGDQNVEPSSNDFDAYVAMIWSLEDPPSDAGKTTLSGNAVRPVRISNRYGTVSICVDSTCLRSSLSTCELKILYEHAHIIIY